MEVQILNPLARIFQLFFLATLEMFQDFPTSIFQINLGVIAVMHMLISLSNLWSPGAYSMQGVIR